MLLDVTTHGITEALLRNRERYLRLADLQPEMEAASDAVYEATRQWYDARGDGTWPELAESTVMRKASHGAGDPERPLYDEGNLYESATSPSGPYSYRHFPGVNDVAIGVDWQVGGWQIPVVHFYGTTTAGAAHSTTIPARPIWPAHSSPEYEEMRAKITELLLRGI